MKKVRGQSAVEFLATYGWAMLLMLAMIAILYYFGAFSGGQYLPRTCYLGAGLSCTSFIISANESGARVLISGSNGLGYDIGFNENAATLTAENLGLAGKNVYTGNCSPSLVLAGRSYTCVVEIPDAERIPRQGEMVRTQIAVSYKNCETNPNYASTGNCSSGTEVNRSLMGELVTQAEPHFNITAGLCGNGECDDMFGETTANCPADCSYRITITANPGTILNNGVDSSVINATVVDPYYFPVEGVGVSFSQDGSADLSAATGTTGADGSVSISLSSIYAETVNVTATTTSEPTGLSASVLVEVGLGTATSIALTAVPDTIMNDGVSSSTITATVLDGDGLPINGAPVSFSITAGSGSLTVAGGSTNPSGQIATALTSLVYGTTTVRGESGAVFDTVDVAVVAPAVTVVPDTATVGIGLTLRFRAYQSGSEITTTASWSVTGGIGTVETTGDPFPGLFSATTAGSGLVTATNLGQSGSASVEVPVGPDYVFKGDSTNYACCFLHCCTSGSPYCCGTNVLGCSGLGGYGTYCCNSISPAWMGLCGSADYLQWTTTDLAAGTYEINGLAACYVMGTCKTGGGCTSASSTCTAHLSINGVPITDFYFADTNPNDGTFTPSTYTYNLGSMSGTKTIKVTWGPDCFCSGTGDRNFMLHDINLVKTG